MNQSTTEQLAATQYVVPVQALQSLPQLAKTTAVPSPQAPGATPSKQSIPWGGIAFVVAIWTAVIAMGFDLAYGGADVRAVQAEKAKAQRETAALQQDIDTAKAALGCPTGGTH